MPGKTKRELRAKRAALDPLELAAAVEKKLEAIYEIVNGIEERRREERRLAGEEEVAPAVAGALGGVASAVADAPCASTSPKAPEVLAKRSPKKEETKRVRVS